MPPAVARLPEGLRDDLKRPMGPVFTDAERLLAAAGEPLVAVGDVVTAHLVGAGRPPDLAVVDERTEREPVDAEVAAASPDPDGTVENPAATLTSALVEAMAAGLASGAPYTLLVDGEEDLAALPAVLLVPEGGAVVYGQPGAGMVLVGVDAEAKAGVRGLLERFEGESGAILALIDASDR